MNNLIIFPSKISFLVQESSNFRFTLEVFLFFAILACELRCKYIVVIILSNNSFTAYYVTMEALVSGHPQDPKKVSIKI